MHGLGESLVGSCKKDQHFCIRIEKVLLRKSPDWTARIDRMDDSPTEREENDALAFQIQVVKFSNAGSVDLLELRENHLDLNFDELTGSPICNSEFESGLFAVRSDNRVAAINNSCGGPGKSAEDHARGERYGENVDQSFDRHKSVGCDSHGDDVPVSDRRERVDAEKNAR